MPSRMVTGDLPGYMVAFGEFARSLTLSDLSNEVRHAVTRMFVDGLGAILIGHREAEVARLCDEMLALGGQQEATILRAGFPKTTRALAALLNGTAGASLEIDEGYRLASNHASISIIPAALAEAEARRASGADLAVAIVVGYEAGARAARATRFARRTQAHGVWSAVGASVAVAKLRGGDGRDLAAALNYGASLTFISCHTQSFHGGTVRNLWNGLGAEAAFSARDLTDAGFGALGHALEDTFGHVSGQSFDPSTFLVGLGSEFAVTRNYFKRHACCGHVNAAIEATLAATGGQPLSGADIETIEVATYRLAAELNDRAPINPMAARFSVPWCVAAATKRGNVDVDASSLQALGDDELRALAKRVQVTLDPEAGDGFSDNRAANVTIRLRDGRVFSSRCDNAPGDFQSPFTDSEIYGKFRQIASRVLGEEAADVMLAAARGLVHIADISEFIALLARRGAAEPTRQPVPLSPARTQRARDALDELSEFVGRTQYEDLPADVRHHGKRVLLDALGVMIAGSAQPQVHRLTETQVRRATLHTATVLGAGFPHAGPLQAALVNGTAACVLELNGGPSLAPAHPGIYTVPAALAWAEHTEATSQEFLTALILGYDVAARMAAAAHLAPTLHPHGVLGAVGAAVAVAKLMELDILQIRETISLASCLAMATSANNSIGGASLRNAVNGRSSFCGVVAAVAVRAGYASPLDGPQRIFGPGISAGFDVSRLVANLGNTYEIVHHYHRRVVADGSLTPVVAVPGESDDEVAATFQDLTHGLWVEPSAAAQFVWAWEAQPTVREFTARLRALASAHPTPKR